MSNLSPEQLVEIYEMGQAYKTITAQMGPSAQLIVFLNRDKITDESLGLESFNVVAQHEKILAEIDAFSNEFLKTLIKK